MSTVQDRKRNSAEDFLRAIEDSASLKEAAQKLGVSEMAVRTRHASFTRKGIPLKQFERGSRKLDVESLTKMLDAVRAELAKRTKTNSK